MAQGGGVNNKSLLTTDKSKGYNRHLVDRNVAF